MEPAQVDEMFYQIPEILLCHEFFLKQLQARMNEWHDKQKIGDIFVSSVRTFLWTSKGDDNIILQLILFQSLISSQLHFTFAQKGALLYLLNNYVFFFTASLPNVSWWMHTVPLSITSCKLEQQSE